MTERGRREDAVELGAALRALQQRSGRTLRALEEQVRISDSSLSRYFRGDTVPPWPVVRDLCRALGADPYAYRTLWEAADRSPAEPPPPPRSEAPDPPSPDRPDQPPADAPDPPQASAPGRRLRTALSGRAAAASAGGLTGLVAGFLVALLTLPLGPPGSPSHGPAGAGRVRDEAASAGAPERAGAARAFVSRATGNCLDSSLDHGLRSYPCNGMSYQRWGLRSSANGAHQLRNHATGLCLDGGGREVTARPCDGRAAQKWTLTSREDEAVRLANVSTGRCLDESADGLRALPCVTGSRQEWG
ncbi:helix-turn-helix domain-containing protein [Streptomyces rubiginosohelvolus]|uniref:helix-turn-helix domain-containing protein n=1 Tax=Streptomyces rubiginosohelvolus TaxID=67362 RepID=UPI0036DD9DB5